MRGKRSYGQCYSSYWDVCTFSFACSSAGTTNENSSVYNLWDIHAITRYARWNGVKKGEKGEGYGEEGGKGEKTQKGLNSSNRVTPKSRDKETSRDSLGRGHWGRPAHTWACCRAGQDSWRWRAADHAARSREWTWAPRRLRWPPTPSHCRCPVVAVVGQDFRIVGGIIESDEKRWDEEKLREERS